MNLKSALTTTYKILSGWRKTNLVAAVVNLRDKYLQLQDRVRQLEQENARLGQANTQLEQENSQLKEQLEREKIKATNKRNQPSSKQAEWEKDSNPGQDKKKRKRRKRKPRKGAGNRPKNLEPNCKETATVDTCDLCGKDLSGQPPLESTNERIIEDIVAPPEETVVTLVIQEKKYCADCQEVTTAKSDLALPGADMGLNATVLVCYLWVALCLPYTKIKEYLGTFSKLSVSTSGLSRHVIRVAGIMKDVHAEILKSIKHSAVLHADETGWRVRGLNWWLWVFGTPDTAYFAVDKTRGSAVVRRVLGEIFFGVLVVDGWSAYLYLLCEQQSCLAHLLRKVRKFRDDFPHLTDIVKFYLKFRRIIRDGERLQQNRDQLGELVSALSRWYFYFFLSAIILAVET
jgi:transposase